MTWKWLRENVILKKSYFEEKKKSDPVCHKNVNVKRLQWTSFERHLKMSFKNNSNIAHKCKQTCDICYFCEIQINSNLFEIIN